jgi:hypothetical protein
MSPRILDTQTCPHCGVALARPTPRTCPSCAGSLQKRYLSTGCLTSRPMLLLATLALGSALALL